jgi:hypothetical protein
MYIGLTVRGGGDGQSNQAIKKLNLDRLQVQAYVNDTSELKTLHGAEGDERKKNKHLGICKTALMAGVKNLMQNLL